MPAFQELTKETFWPEMLAKREAQPLLGDVDGRLVMVRLGEGAQRLVHVLQAGGLLHQATSRWSDL